MNTTPSITALVTSTTTAGLQPLILANLIPKQRAFIEYFYINVYDPTQQTNLWNPNLGSFAFNRAIIKSICKKFGYAGTIQWIVRKPFGRRTDRGLYYIPEVKELHDLWECSVIDTTILTHAGQNIAIRRANNKTF